MNMDRSHNQALVLDTEPHWARAMADCVKQGGAFSDVQVHHAATLSDVVVLASGDWGLVIMDAAGAAIDQCRPLEALVCWARVAPDVPVLVISDFPSSAEARDAVGLSATFYSSKPWDASQLRELIRTTLDLYEGRREIPEAVEVERVRREDYLERFGGR